MKRRHLVVLSTVTPLLLLPLFAYAAGGEGHEHHVSSIADLRFSLPPFVVFFGGLYLLLRKPFRSFWEKRSEEIREQIFAGEKKLELAQSKLDEVNRRKSGVDAEIAQLRSVIQRETSQEAETLIAQARERSARIREQASMSLSAEKQSQEALVRKELAEKVIEQAKSQLIAQTDEGADARYRNAAFSQIGSVLRR
ncbi:MAG: ATP synthase F0 subunit B [Bdellovibrionales bacterium]|nr:ATP synthase F0 subunit B [Bdellovibrionales bacterium]